MTVFAKDFSLIPMSVWYQVFEANCNEVTLAQDFSRRREPHAPYRTLTQEEFNPNFPQYTQKKKREF